MTYKHARLIIISVLVLVASLLFGCRSDTIYSSKLLNNVALSSQIDKQYQPINATTVFRDTTEKIYCSFSTSKAPIGAMITARWVYIVKEAADKPYIIDQFTQPKNNQERMVMFLSRPTNGWQRGDYWVALFINSLAELQIPFSIK